MRVWVLLLSLLLLAGSSQPVFTEKKLDVIVDAKHAEFVIKLKSNPTTGYAWFLRKYNHQLVVPVKHDFEAPKTTLIGASGYELWTFRMLPAAFVVPQQMAIAFVYARPQDVKDQATKLVFHVTTVGGMR